MLLVGLVGMLALAAWRLDAQSLPYEAMAARIVAALQTTPGERILLRVDPGTMAALAPLVRKQLEARGAVVETLPYGPAPGFEARLARTDVYVWLPAPSTATPADQGLMLQRWIDQGSGREVHFHWVDGTRNVDGLPAQHTPAYDRVYVDALDIDYQQLAERMDRAIQRLRAGEIRVTTPAGTDGQLNRNLHLQTAHAQARVPEARRVAGSRCARRPLALRRGTSPAIRGR